MFLFPVKIQDSCWSDERKEIGFKSMWVNSDNELLKAQWESGFCMERYSFEKLVKILTQLFAKKYTNLRKAITLQIHVVIALWRL